MIDFIVDLFAEIVADFFITFGADHVIDKFAKRKEPNPQLTKKNNVTLIGQSDGPTSIFLAGKAHGGKRSLKQKWQKYIYDRKKKRQKGENEK